MTHKHSSAGRASLAAGLDSLPGRPSSCTTWDVRRSPSLKSGPEPFMLGRSGWADEDARGGLTRTGVRGVVATSCLRR
jgi:hypothetical protein